MKRSCFLFLVLLVAAVGWTPSAHGAFDFIARHEGAFHPVVKVRGDTPYVKVDGRLVAADPASIALVPQSGQVDLELPHWVQVSPIKANRGGVNYYDLQKVLNLNLTFEFEVESPVRLENVYAVFSLFTERAGSGNLMEEIGTLRPFSSTTVKIRKTLPADLGETRYVVHLFSNGRPLYTNQSEENEFESQFAAIALQTRPESGESEPSVLFSFPPQSKGTASGKVAVKCGINSVGRVTSIEVLGSLDAPAEKAVVEAVARWRFLPAWKNGRAVASVAMFEFDPVDRKKWSNQVVRLMPGSVTEPAAHR